jgi:hypothetical protein
MVAVPRRQGVPLGQRPALGRPAQSLPTTSGPPRRHCWVTGPPAQPGPWPGLVIQWRREPGGWYARVVYLVYVDGNRSEPTTVDGWVSAEQLSPA